MRCQVRDRRRASMSGERFHPLEEKSVGGKKIALNWEALRSDL